ncbi:hypothetical protein B0H11DRAFT_2297916 [Mycena galericulata]|nr:hypothetical protein B0H11DRAFT_2297916 [Mycena galericulata]
MMASKYEHSLWRRCAGTDRCNTTDTDADTDIGVWLDDTAFALQSDEEEYLRYGLNLGAETESVSVSVCPTPPLLRSKLPAEFMEEEWVGEAGNCNGSSDPHASPASTPSSVPSQPESEEEDATDYSFPALAHARALQSRRHAPHPISSVLGLRGGLLSLARVAVGVAVVAVLAGSGRWGSGGAVA